MSRAVMAGPDLPVRLATAWTALITREPLPDAAPQPVYQ